MSKQSGKCIKFTNLQPVLSCLGYNVIYFEGEKYYHRCTVPIGKREFYCKYHGLNSNWNSVKCTENKQANNALLSKILASTMGQETKSACSHMQFAELRDKDTESASVLIEVSDTKTKQSYFVKLFYRVRDIKHLQSKFQINSWGNTNMENECVIYKHISDTFSKQDVPVMKKFFLNLVQACQFDNLMDIKQRLQISSAKDEPEIRIALDKSVDRKFDKRKQVYFRDKLMNCKITAIITNLQTSVKSIHAFMESEKSHTIICEVFMDLVTALNYMHSVLGILHNDLHFGNILVTNTHKDQWRPLLFDWDRSMSLDDTKLKLQHTDKPEPYFGKLIMQEHGDFIGNKIAIYLNTSQGGNSVVNHILNSKHKFRIWKPRPLVDLYMLYLGYVLRSKVDKGQSKSIWIAFFGKNNAEVFDLVYALLWYLVPKLHQLQAISWCMKAVTEFLIIEGVYQSVDPDPKKVYTALMNSQCVMDKDFSTEYVSQTSIKRTV